MMKVIGAAVGDPHLPSPLAPSAFFQRWLLLRRLTTAGKPGKKHRWSHGQEYPHRHHTHHRPDGEVCTRDKMAVDTISDDEIEDNTIQQAREQARGVGVAANCPIHMDRQRMGDKSSHPDQRQDNPMPSKVVKEQVTGCNRSNGPRVNTAIDRRAMIRA